MLSRRTVFRYSAALLGAHLVEPLSAWAVGGQTVEFDLEEVTIAELQQRMERGVDTARSLVAKYLARIDAIDRSGPMLRQILEVNPDALAIASTLDQERRDGAVRGPLHGIPVLLKDNIDTADRMTTTAGSLALKGSIAARDAFVARRLRDAGAILLAKTNMSEWANFRSTQSSSGWSGRGGQGKNPYALDRSPAGSSSGSGAGVAASFAAVGIGTETDGSIVSPASYMSLVGIKPTVGLVSRSGIIPIAQSQDTAGPMARTVTDAAVLLTVMAGADPDDESTTRRPAGPAIDYTKFLDSGGLKGARLGILRNQLFGYSVPADRLAEVAIVEMRRLGAIVIDPVELSTPENLGDNELEVLLQEFKSGIDAYLAKLSPSIEVRSLKDLIDFNERHRELEMPYFGQELFMMAQRTGPLTSMEYTFARENNLRATQKEGIDALMDEHKLDALVGPTAAPPTPIDLVNGDAYPGGASRLPAIAGYPHITVPAGYAFGLPVGLSFFGRSFSEPALIRLAYAFEQATRHRKPPRFLPTAELG